MPRTGRTYEKPSRLSQGLVICFSIAVVAMAGWLALVIMSHGTRTMAADGTDVEATSQPVAARVVAEPEKAGAMDRFNAAYFAPGVRYYPPSAAAPPRSALALTDPAPIAVRDPVFPAPPAMAAIPDTSYRDIPIDEPLPEEAVIGAPDGNAELVPLPLPNPRRIAAIPVPRPRPRADGEDAQGGAESSFFDFMINRQR